MPRPLHLAALLVIWPSLAPAQTAVPKLDQDGRPGEIARVVYQKAVRQFDQADADKDGKLSREEVAKVAPFKAEAFSSFDKNGDGYLSWQEFVGHDRWKKDDPPK